MRYGCALLAGGRGRRMGEVNKARLEYGDRTFADRIAAEMEAAGMPCYISVASYEQKVPEGWTQVIDEVTGADGGYIGPMGGICSCLRQAERDGLDGLFFVPCDAPLFDREIILRLEKLIDDDTEAACWITADGKLQTAFGWYSVRALSGLESDIARGYYKLKTSIEKLDLTTAYPAEHGIASEAFENINTKDDYLRMKRALTERDRQGTV